MVGIMLLRIAGAVLVVVTLVDVIATVVSVGLGRGPATRYVSRAIYSVFRGGFERWPEHRMLAVAGPTVLFGTVTTWVLGLVFGWAFVFTAPGALEVTSPDGSLHSLSRFYYAASTVLGRGSALYEPATNVWQVVEQVAGATGVALFGLAIAYTLAVVNAVVKTRRIAAHISTLGFSADEILHRAWNGDDFGHLDLHFIALVPEICEVARLHLAFPLLFYFHSTDRRSAVAPNLAALDDTLTALNCCADEARPLSASVEPLRAAIDDFLDALYKAFVSPLDQAPAPPALRRLGDTGARVVGAEGISDEYIAYAERRRLFAALVDHDAWTWDDVEGIGHDRELAVSRDA